MLTDTHLKNLKPKTERYYVADTGGLRIAVQPCGSKIWQHRFRFYVDGKDTVQVGMVVAILKYL